MRRAQRRLALLWFSAAAALFLLILFQSVFGRYGREAVQAWAWFLPTIVPTLSLMVGVLVVEAGQANTSRGTVNRFSYRLVFWLSGFYLLLVSLTVLLGPVAESVTQTSPLELMSRSHLWLAPCQGIVVGALGAFFIRKDG